ncbi:hypothetical protein D3C76_1343310 [compost metagenome]
MLVTAYQFAIISKLPRATGQVNQVINSGRLEELILQCFVANELLDLKLLQSAFLCINSFAQFFFLSLFGLEALLPSCICSIDTLIQQGLEIHFPGLQRSLVSLVFGLSQNGIKLILNFLLLSENLRVL